MTHNYSSQQILKYLYGELPLTERLEAEYAIEHSSEWKESYKRLKSSLQLLPKVHFFPKQRIVRSILDYSSITA